MKLSNKQWGGDENLNIKFIWPKKRTYQNLKTI